MKEMLIFLLVAGVLILGTCAVVGEISEEISLEHVDFSEGKDFGNLGGNPSPCGGGSGGGPGGAPG